MNSSTEIDSDRHISVIDWNKLNWKIQSYDIYSYKRTKCCEKFNVERYIFVFHCKNLLMPTTCAITFRLLCAITFRVLYTANSDRILRVNCGKFHWAKVITCVGWYTVQRQKQRLRPDGFVAFFSSYIKRFFRLCNFPDKWGGISLPHGKLSTLCWSSRINWPLFLPVRKTKLNWLVWSSQSYFTQYIRILLKFSMNRICFSGQFLPARKTELNWLVWSSQSSFTQYIRFLLEFSRNRMCFPGQLRFNCFTSDFADSSATKERQVKFYFIQNEQHRCLSYNKRQMNNKLEQKKKKCQKDSNDRPHQLVLIEGISCSTAQTKDTWGSANRQFNSRLQIHTHVSITKTWQVIFPFNLNSVELL